jgi:3-oxoacyl-[acyl-carrier-protein] synthase-3
MKEIGISSIGAAVPEKLLTNADLEKMVDTTDEWITTRTGIRERHILRPEENIYEIVTKAARMACETIELDPDKLDFIVSSTLTPDRFSPAQACEVARELGANHGFCFDLNAACSGFVFGLAMAESLLKSRNDLSYGLVTAGEQLSRVTDYSDRSSCVLFGDGATAAVVTSDRPQHLLLCTELGSDPSMSQEVVIGGINDLLQDRRSNYYFRQNGKVVFKFAVSKIKELLETVPAKVGIKPEQIKYVIPHQANQRIIAAGKDFSIGDIEFISNIEKYGNTSSASIGLALHENWHRFQKGDYVMLIAFGGGLSWGAALIQW